MMVHLKNCWVKGKSDRGVNHESDGDDDDDESDDRHYDEYDGDGNEVERDREIEGQRE